MKRSLFEKVEFPAGYWFEDTVIDMILYPTAAKCIIINAPVYNYLLNPNGITRISSGKKKALTVSMLSLIHHLTLPTIPDV